MTDISQSLIDCLEDGVIILNRDCLIVQHNAAIERLIQTSEPQIVGRARYAVLPCQFSEDIREESECPALQVFSFGKSIRTSCYREIDGQPIWYDILISPLRDESGEVTLALEVWRDVSQMKQMLDDAHLCEDTRDRELERSNVLAYIIEAQEEERKRIARELHDETNQVLTTLDLKVTTIIKGLPEGHDGLHAELTQLKSGIERVMDNIQAVILDLRPSPLDDLGLIPALKWYASTKLEPLGIEVSFEVSGRQTNLSNEREITVFRVVQEAINNVVQHAQASQVSLHVLFEKACLNIQVRDNGQGFVVDEFFDCKDQCRGLGLLGMRERLVLVGGTIDIRSAPQAGTRLQIQIPLSQDKGQGQDP